MKNLLALLTACMLSVFFVTTSSAVEGYSETGTIDAVRLTDRHIIVDDGLYSLAPDVIVFSESGKAASLQSLQHGMNIAFNAISQKGKRGSITELLILNQKPKSKSRHK